MSNSFFDDPKTLNAQDYLAALYTGPLSEPNKELLRFYADVYLNREFNCLLEFGGGPCLYSLISAARSVEHIHFVDYNVKCLLEIEKWIRGDVSSFDWRQYISFALSCESPTIVPDENSIELRHELIKARIDLVSRCDIFADDPLVGSSLGPYDVVTNNFCLDAIAREQHLWGRFNEKLADLVKPGGLFITLSLLNANYWNIGDSKYPATRLSLNDVQDLYVRLNFNVLHSEILNVSESSGYDGFIMVYGEKQI